MTHLPWTPQHVGVADRPQFPLRRGGYNKEDVDRYFAHVAALMRAGREVPPFNARGVRRSPVREGYAVEPVAALCDQIGAWQVELASAASLSSSSLASSAASSSADVAAPGGPVPSTPALATDDAARSPLRWTPQQIDWVRESTFGSRRGHKAYTESEVDQFLDEVLVAMAKGEPLPDIDDARFYLARVGQVGYDAVEVDEFLDHLKRLRPAR